MKKTTMIGMTALLGLTLSACGNSSTPSSSRSSEKATATQMASTGVSLDKYQSIKIALTDTGTATTESAVKSLFGKSDQSTKTTIAGLSKQATQYTWTNMGKGLDGATVTVSFYGEQAVAKAYFSATLTPNSKITPSSVSEVKTGDTLSSVKSRFGTPNAESQSGSGAFSAQIINYTSIKGMTGASVSFTFSNSKLTSTTKTSFN